MPEIKRLRRIASTLHRWSVAECNGEIQRDEETDRPYCPGYRSSITGQHQLYPIPDREAGALKRLAAIMAAHPDLWAYRQGDPRGCALYVGKRADLKTTDNQIVAKARAWGGIETDTDSEASAIRYLKGRGASIPAHNLLPLEQHYMRGITVY